MIAEDRDDYVVFKFFLPFNAIDKQEKWLNKMNENGYELIKTTYWHYYFKKTNKQIIYRVQYVEPMIKSDYDDYIEFLDNSNIKYFTKSIRMSYSLHNARLMFFGLTKPKFTTTNGLLNKELLILALDSNLSTEIYNDRESLKKYYSERRFVALFYAIILLGLSYFDIGEFFSIRSTFFGNDLFRFSLSNISMAHTILRMFVMLIAFVFICKSISLTLKIFKLKRNKNLYE